MTDDEKRHLDEQGYVVLRGLIDTDLLQALKHRIAELFDEEGSACGSRVQAGRARASTLESRRQGRSVPACGDPAGLLDYVRHVLGPGMKLSSLNARSADPHSEDGQPLHVDMGAIPDEQGYWVCNTVWMLDAFTPRMARRGWSRARTNGALVRRTSSNPMAPHPDEILLTGEAGTIAVMNAHMWHGGTANRTGAPRLAMHAFYCRSDKPQQQYQKRLLRPEVQAGMGPDLRRLLALDDPRNDG